VCRGQTLQLITAGLKLHEKKGLQERSQMKQYFLSEEEILGRVILNKFGMRSELYAINTFTPVTY
jgi:hypothetical protein